MPYDDNANAHTETYRGYHIAIQYDMDSLNPRKENDNAGTMVCFHKNYDLGDDHEYDAPSSAVAAICDIDEDDLLPCPGSAYELKEALDKAPLYVLPLYLYDHSGITMNTTGFNCPWDSGQVGFIYITNETADEEWPLREDESEEERSVRIYNYLVNEVKEYDDYLTGNVYGYVISTLDEDGEAEDEIPDGGSCWGFLGDYETNALIEARAVIDGIHDEAT